MAIEITTFGEFDIKRAGRSILPKSSRANKNLELLKYFITHRHKRLVPEAIIENLWPRDDFVDPRNALRVQIFRLRKNLEEMGLLGDQDKDYLDITFENGSYVLTMKHEVRIDTDLFEEGIKEANSLRSTDPGQAIKRYLEIAKLYRGEYLAENPYNEWTFIIRNRYHRQFLQAMLRLLELLNNKGEFLKIVDLCERIMALEPLEEALHIHYLDALIQLEEYQNALHHYNYYTERAYKEMLVRPSPIMRSLYQQIVAHNRSTERINLAEVERAFREDDYLEGTHFCDLDSFKTIYNLERRKIMRAGAGPARDIFLGLITINKRNAVLSGEDSKMACSILQKILLESLRKGDTFACLNASQIVILLFGILEPSLQLITKRLQRRYSNEVPVNSGYYINISFQPVGTEESFI